MKRAGFTLLEVILATSLAAVVVWLLGMAINIHLRVADTSRYDVEQAQLARTLLQRIGDDLRNTAPFSPSKSSTGSSAGSAQSSSSMSSSSTSSSTTTSIGALSADGQDSTATGDLSGDMDVSNVGLSTAGGICGDGQNLQMEICRMPRLDRILAASMSDGSMPMVSQGDARNVFYSVAGAGALGEVAEGSDQGGLVRREMDRSTFNYVVQQGQVSDVDQSIEVLAPEVEAIQFQYFDDGMPYDMWDSSQMGKLPTAVKVSLWLRRPEPKANSFFAPSADDAPVTPYSLMVFLPNSKAAPNQALTAAAQQAKAAAKQPQEIKSQDSLFGQDKQALQAKDDKTKSSTGKTSAAAAPTQLQLPNQSGGKQQQPQQIQQIQPGGKGGR